MISVPPHPPYKTWWYGMPIWVYSGLLKWPLQHANKSTTDLSISHWIFLSNEDFVGAQCGVPKWLTRQPSVRKNTLHLTAKDISNFFPFLLISMARLKDYTIHVLFITFTKLIVQEYAIRNTQLGLYLE